MLWKIYINLNIFWKILGKWHCFTFLQMSVVSVLLDHSFCSLLWYVWFTWNMWRKSSLIGKRENVLIAFSNNDGNFSLIIYQNVTRSILYRLMAMWIWNCINELFIFCCIKVHCYLLYFAFMHSFTYSLGLYVCAHLTCIFFPCTLNKSISMHDL